MSSGSRRVGARVYTDDNYYFLLGVTPRASTTEIERAFRQQAPLYHPDKNGGSAALFRRLEEAKRVLLDPKERQEYDMTREADDVRDRIMNMTGNVSTLSLPTCKKLSDQVRKNIANWTSEFQNIRMVSNVQSAMETILGVVGKRTEETGLSEGINDFFYCDICNREFLSEDDHYDTILEPYVTELLTDVTGRGLSIFAYLREKLNLGEDRTEAVEALTEEEIRPYLKLAQDQWNDGNKEDARVLYTLILFQLEDQPGYPVVIDLLSSLVQEHFKNDPFSVSEGYRHILRSYPANFAEADRIHDLFLEKYIRQDTLEDYKLALAALHYSDLSKMEKFITSAGKTLQKILLEAIRDYNFDQLTQVLSLINCDNVHILEDHLNGQDEQAYGGESLAIIKLLKAVVMKANGDFPSSLNLFNETIDCCCQSSFQHRGPIAAAVAQLATDTSLHKKTVKNLFDNIKELGKNPKANCAPSINPELKLEKLFNLQMWNRQVPPTPFVISKRNEEAIEKRFKTPLGKALAYFDLSMGVNQTARLSCWLIAISQVLEAMGEEQEVSVCYAYLKVIELFCALSLQDVRKTHGPNMQIYTYRFIFSAVKDSCYLMDKKYQNQAEEKPNKEPIVSLERVTLATQALTEIANLVKIFPFSNISMQSSTDTVLRHPYELLLCTHFVHSKANGKSDNKFFPKRLYSHQVLDGTWRGWGDEDILGTFEEARFNSMCDMLEWKGWSWEEVEDIMSWPLQRRTEHGWRNNEELDLNFDDQPLEEIFQSCRGVEINLKTGESTLLLDQAKNDSVSAKLFCMEDVLEVFNKEISGAALTLEDPDPSLNTHPFQEYSYYPPTLKDTSYLSTMLHADYLLKEITTGTEVNGFCPFEIRSSADGFMQRLPPELQLLLRPILERMRDPINSSSEKAHRFWIQAGAIQFTQVRTEESIKFEFASGEMSVATKLLKRLASGRFVDDDDVDILSSAEYQLAECLTKNYEVLGSYFPILLRLRELAKLSAVREILVGRALRLEEEITSPEELKEMKDNIISSLSEFRNTGLSPPHPIYTNARFNECWQDVLRSNGLVGQEHRIEPGNKSSIQNQIINELSKADESRFTSIANNLVGLFGVQFSLVHPLIRGWLDRNSAKENQLMDICYQGKLAKLRETNLACLQNLAKINILPKSESREVKLSDNGECVWVPATFCSTFKPPIQLSSETIEDHQRFAPAVVDSDSEEEDGEAQKTFYSSAPALKTSPVPAVSNSNGLLPLSASPGQQLAQVSDKTKQVATPVNPQKLVSETGERANADSSKSAKKGKRNAPTETRKGLKLHPPTGVKPPRIYGGVLLQAARVVVPMLLPPPIRVAYRIGSMALAARNLAGSSSRSVGGTRAVNLSSRPGGGVGSLGGSARGGATSGVPPRVSSGTSGSGSTRSSSTSGGGQGNGGGRGAGSGSGGGNGRGGNGNKPNSSNNKNNNNNNSNNGNNRDGGSRQENAKKYENPKTTYEAKLGPSGKPMRHFPRFTSRKAAKDAAFQRGGKNKPNHDSPHKEGQPPHFHAVGRNGERLETGEHFSYGKGNIRAGRNSTK